MDQVVAALDEAGKTGGKPCVLLAHTIKGKGISFAENNVSFHNGVLTEELYQKALQELSGAKGA